MSAQLRLTPAELRNVELIGLRWRYDDNELDERDDLNLTDDERDEIRAMTVDACDLLTALADIASAARRRAMADAA